MGTAEIHLATGFQNMIYDSKSFPGDLREKIYKYIKTNLKDEWKEKDTEEQFIYKTRKKACGPFKLELWHLPEKTREKLCAELEKQFSFLFEKLKVTGKQSIVKKYIKPVDVHLEMPAAFKS